MTTDNTQMMNGWIKLSRGIRAHWVWNNPRWLQWWLDLLLLAAWEDTVVRKRRRWVPVRRGEVCLSVRELQRRWGLKSMDVIYSFIRLLEDDEMIIRSKRRSFTSREGAKMAAEHFAEHFAEQKTEHFAEQSAEQKTEQFYNVITICNYANYQVYIAASRNTFRNTSRNDSGNSSRNDNRNAKAEHINKEYKEDNISSSPSRVREEFENFSSERVDGKEIPFDEKAFWESLWDGTNNELWEAARREFKTDSETLVCWVRQVENQWRARPELHHKDYDDAFEHLMSTLRKKDEYMSKRQKKAGGANAARQSAREEARRQARGVPPTPEHPPAQDTPPEPTPFTPWEEA